MEVVNYSSKLVKPSTPTSTIDRYYKLSFFDEVAPTMNIPLILYYAASSKDPNGPFQNFYDHVEDTLSKALSDFYPLAGRYIRKLSMIDCNDRGVLFVPGKANVRLLDILNLGHKLEPDALNMLLPREVGEADEMDDPMLSVKVTTFECGGFAIGMCFSHRISDIGALSNFINNWAARSNETYEDEKCSPHFNLAVRFPQRGLPELDVRMPRSSVGVKGKARRFVFKGKVISAMRENVGFDNNGRRPSKVQLVVALLWKAFVHIDQVNNGQSKASFLIQPVGLRDKVLHELPANSCGNFWGLAPSRLKAGEGEKLTFCDFFKILRESVSRTVNDCTRTLTHDVEGYEVLIDSYLEANRNMFTNNVVSFYFFTSWCKFSYYEADFGCGKPIWASTGKLPTQNLVIMMDDHEGDGVEAWVHLDEKRMKQLEQDSDIKAYAI